MHVRCTHVTGGFQAVIEAFRDRVVILGYGSLIWDLDDLAPHVSGPWFMDAGPALPLEFSRISPKRLMGLVVCVDPVHGAPCPSHAIVSVRETVAEARTDLARRERSAEANIGAWSRDASVIVGKIAPVAEAWCAATGAAGVVWTELPANFAEVAGRPFDHPAAEAWLAALEGPARDEAVRYIENAPAATDTALRRRLAGLAWWRAEAARVARL